MEQSGSTWLGRALREPLVHFVALGLALFLLFGATGTDDTAQGQTIEIGQGEIQWLVNGFTRQWRRAPTEQELRGMIDARVREEVLYREALAMRLDQDDEIVRRRLAQKMEFLADDLATLAPPDDSVLRRLYRDDAERYRIPESRAFRHIYFSLERREADAEPDAARALSLLRQDNPPDPAQMGDGFLLPDAFDLRDHNAVARDFGEEFATAIFSAPVGEWYGPVRSGYGLHLVKVTDRIPPQDPGFDQVRDRLLIDYQRQQREATNSRLFETLSSRYDIRVDEDAIERLRQQPESGRVGQ